MLEVCRASVMADRRGVGKRKSPAHCRAVHYRKSCSLGSVHDLGQFALGVLLRHDRQALALDLRALAFAAELEVTGLANGLGRGTRGLEPLTGVELVGVLGQELAHRAR